MFAQEVRGAACCWEVRSVVARLVPSVGRIVVNDDDVGDGMLSSRKYASGVYCVCASLQLRVRAYIHACGTIGFPDPGRILCLSLCARFEFMHRQPAALKRCTIHHHHHHRHHHPSPFRYSEVHEIFKTS